MYPIAWREEEVKRLIWLNCLLGCLIIFTTHPITFLYPVAALQSRPWVFLIHQTSSQEIELWVWNYQTKKIRKDFLPGLKPAGLAVLPYESGFSFVDNGIFKVDFLHEKKPHIIAFDTPLYDVSSVHWIDDHCCYFSAKKRNHYGIFQVNMQGEVDTIVLSCASSIMYRQGIEKGYDCLYPQKVHHTLFYIERKKKVQQYYRIMSMPYPPIDKEVETNSMQQDDKKVVIDFGEQAIAFLHMVSVSEGFVVSYPHEVEKESNSIQFTYHHIKKKKNEWHESELFSFAIPTDFLFLDTDMRLYESMLPLLPRHIGKHIYFTSSMLGSDNLTIFSYSIGLGSIKQITFALDSHYFAPCLLAGEHTLLFGIVLGSKPA